MTNGRAGGNWEGQRHRPGMHVSLQLLSSPKAGLTAEFRFDWALVFVTCASVLLLFRCFAVKRYGGVISRGVLRCCDTGTLILP